MVECPGESSAGVALPSMTNAPGSAYQLAASTFEFRDAATTCDYAKVHDDQVESLSVNAGPWLTSAVLGLSGCVNWHAERMQIAVVRLSIPYAPFATQTNLFRARM